MQSGGRGTFPPKHTGFEAVTIGREHGKHVLESREVLSLRRYSTLYVPVGARSLRQIAKDRLVLYIFFARDWNFDNLTSEFIKLVKIKMLLQELMIQLGAG